MKNTIMEKIYKLKNDAYISDCDSIVYLYLNDFEGFDKDWNENLRGFDNPKLIESTLEFLANNAKEVDLDYYSTYTFDDCQVVVGYGSYDI